jgi:hypothetical protein
MFRLNKIFHIHLQCKAWMFNIGIIKCKNLKNYSTLSCTAWEHEPSLIAIIIRWDSLGGDGEFRMTGGYVFGHCNLVQETKEIVFILPNCFVSK